MRVSSYDTMPSVLKRPLPEPSVDDEPQSKRQKSDEEASKALCIEDKVNQDAYQLLDQLMLDLNKVIRQQIVELRSVESNEGDEFDEKALIELNKLKEKALEMHNREMSYPHGAPTPAMKGPTKIDELVQQPGEDNTVLTIYGQAPHGRTLFSSLPKRKWEDKDSEGAAKNLSADVQLPEGVERTTVLPSTASQQPVRVPTLGELFPSPANLPPLEAPKTNKTTTKSKVLGFYHPELTERAPYRYDRDSYFHKDMSIGVWLDYSNATPTNKSKDRQRDRVLSLSGQKSPGEDVEVSEMEALFRGAFSSFAPEKDDSGAVISSGEVGRVWFQRTGCRYVQRLYETGLPVEEDHALPGITATDEEEIAKAIEDWDESLVDPSLAGAKDGKKSDEDKEVEDTLQEISDLIETLSSYQRNRLLTLPNGQNRNATDPAKVDMLNGSLAEPSDEERETYEMLRDQLAVIIQSLPPYAVARLNSDKLEELNVSTKVEIRSEVYKGIMEEDETSARLRQQQTQAAQAAQAAAQTPRQAHRTPSFHGNTPAAYQSGQQQPYARHQYQVANQTPVPVPNHYQQSPVRQQVPPSYQRQVSAPMGGVQPQQHRPSGGQPFARPSGWNQQPMQPLRNYGGSGGIPSYAGTPGQGRAASAYQPQHAQPGTPGRYPQGYPGYNPQQQHQAGMQQQFQQPGAISAQMNGAGSMPARTMSPQVSQFPAAQSYSPRAVPQSSPRPQAYGAMGQAVGHPAGIPRFPSNGVHPSPAPQSPATPWGTMTPEQRYQFQTQQRMQALGKANSFNEKMQQNHHAVAGNHHGVAGLGGIGLGGPPVDYQKLAHMRANMAGGVGQSSPSPRMPGAAVPAPAGMNGMPQHMASPSPGPVPGATPSPAPTAGMGAKPPTPVQ